MGEALAGAAAIRSANRVRIATFIGDNNVNIGRLYLGRKKVGESALALIQIDQPMTEEVLNGLAALPDVISVKQITL